MNLTLTRNKKGLYGIYGVLSDAETGKNIAVTLEHSYLGELGDYSPKLPIGEYTCKRGVHKLPGHDSSFETFEITNVPGHTSILFHRGNTNNDSEGCVLLGLGLGTNCIYDSRAAFDIFMKLQAELDEFRLTVS